MGAEGPGRAATLGEPGSAGDKAAPPGRAGALRAQLLLSCCVPRPCLPGPRPAGHGAPHQRERSWTKGSPTGPSTRNQPQSEALEGLPVSPPAPGSRPPSTARLPWRRPPPHPGPSAAQSRGLSSPATRAPRSGGLSLASSTEEDSHTHQRASRPQGAARPPRRSPQPPPLPRTTPRKQHCTRVCPPPHLARPPQVLPEVLLPESRDLAPPAPRPPWRDAESRCSASAR